MRTDQYWTPSSTLEVTEEVTELDKKISVWNRNAWLNYTSVLAKGLEILEIKTIS